MDRDLSPREPDRHDRPPILELPVSREEKSVTGLGFAYFVSDAQTETMRDIGRFRTINEKDLQDYRYPNQEAHMKHDLRSLQEQGLVQRRTLWTGKQAEKLSVYVLTKRAKTLLDQGGERSGQKLFTGFVKPREAHHDAAIYRMFHTEAAKIERAGGRIKRVVLDYELKQEVYPPLAKLRAKTSPTSLEYGRHQAQIAQENRLKVVRGKILLPDLRIEFDAPSGERTHVDLELATRHYRGSSMRAKAEAGFKLYAPKGSLSGRAAAFDPGFAAEIFSF